MCRRPCACARVSAMCSGCVSKLLVLLLCSVVYSRQSCLLPPHPLNGRYTPLELDCPREDTTPECRGVPGKQVDDGWLLVVTCNDGHTPSVPEPLDTPSVCEDGDWSPPLPTCSGGSNSSGGRCVLPPQPSRGEYKLTQDECGMTGNNMGHPGTSVTAGCALHYSCDDGFDIRGVKNKRVVCSDSKWSPSPFNIACKPKSKLDAECVLPEWPENGKFEPVPMSCWENHNQTDAAWVQGAPVLPGCVILFSCDEGYLHKEENDQSFSICENGFWSPEPSSMTCEISAPVPTTAPPPGSPKQNGCQLPAEPANRRYIPWVPSADTTKLVFHAPGAEIMQAAKVQCEPGYGLPDYKDSHSIFCLNGTWMTGEIPECLKLCPPLESTSMYILCEHGKKIVNCSRPMLPDTTVAYKCRPVYTEHACLTKEGVYKRTLTCKSDGKWSYVLPECRPECGLSRGDGVLIPTIIDGEPVKLGQFPWHAGLYVPGKSDEPQWKYICGGSLITARIVLTAAHCVSQLEVEDLRVTLGKYYRSWDAKGDHHARRCSVSRIRVPPEYRASATDYAFDIALLLLSESLEFNSVIRPVCMDVNRDFEIKKSIETYVVGWGETEVGGTRAEHLLYSKLDIWEKIKCIRKLPGILSFDKICGSKDSNSVVEKGDSGGGMTAVFDGVHYVFGIVSLKFRNESVFTNVTWSTHKSWLNKEIELLNDS